MENTTQEHERSLADLMRELRDETTTLFKQEIALAKTELSENAAKAGRNVATLGIGAMVAYGGFILLLVALSLLAQVGLQRAGLNPEIARWLGPAAVGLVVAIIGYILIAKAKSTLSHESLAPKKTIQTLKEDKQWTQEKLSRA
jgi:hypothetical protein